MGGLPDVEPTILPWEPNNSPESVALGQKLNRFRQLNAHYPLSGPTERPHRAVVDHQSKGITALDALIRHLGLPTRILRDSVGMLSKGVEQRGLNRVRVSMEALVESVVAANRSSAIAVFSPLRSKY